jgi:hypothetical protein
MPDGFAGEFKINILVFGVMTFSKSCKLILKLLVFKKTHLPSAIFTIS